MLFVPLRCIIAALVVCLLSEAFAASVTKRPNVVIVLTDDQGYGDIAAHGNPILKTPNLDKLHGESLRFTDFHVSPFCTSTRGALMTGHYPGRNGAFRTSSGRTMLHTDESTLAEIFAANGYATGMIGKWHLGDHAPHRPQDRGFQEVLWHKGGGVGQGPDYWGNDYFGDTYERAGVDQMQGSAEKFKGYCSDVWFDEATRFVQRHQDEPFFLYLATNAPHGPYRIGKEWSRPYRGVPGKWTKEFYGMIANLDHNIGLFRQRLQELGLAENTIFIFMTDNGSAKGTSVFNAGMRGAKSSIWEGGHRVPFFIYWPEGRLGKPQDVNAMAAHIDVLPTLAELCQLDLPTTYQPDGISLVKALKKPKAKLPRSPIVVQFHGGVAHLDPLEPWTNSAVLANEWRLVNGKQLYQIHEDPAQKKDLAAEHPEVIERLRAKYFEWWETISPRMTAVRIDLGNPDENPVHLNSQDWYLPKGNPPWSQAAIKALPRTTGPWLVDVKQAGSYRFILRQLPEVAQQSIQATRAKIEIAGMIEEQTVRAGAQEVVFTLELAEGPAELITYFYDESGQAGGAYYTSVEQL